jgi:hypothetical protein
VIAFTNFLQTVRLNKISSLMAIIAALALSFCSFTLIDRYTVFSYTPRVDTLSFIPQARIDLLKTKGTQRSYGIDIGTLDEEEHQALTLIHLKGLGYQNFLRLKAHGIRNVEELARCDEKTLSRILDEPNLRRVRVYLKAARKARDRVS